MLTTPFLILLMCTITLLLSFTIFHHFLPFFYITFTTFYHILLIFTTFHGLLLTFILFFSFKKDFITFFSEINQSHHFVGCFAITGNSISVRNGGHEHILYSKHWWNLHLLLLTDCWKVIKGVNFIHFAKCNFLKPKILPSFTTIHLFLQPVMLLLPLSTTFCYFLLPSTNC